MLEKECGEGFSIPEGFELPTESVLLADARRDVYESELIHALIRTPDMNETLLTPEQKKAAIDARMGQTRYLLTTPGYDVQQILDNVDLEKLAEETISDAMEVSPEYENAQPYQLEYYQRSVANDLSSHIDENPIRRAIFKRFVESRKLAEETAVDEEGVFNDQQLYFQLIRRSTSPEDIVRQYRDYFMVIRSTLADLVRMQTRFDLVVGFSDSETVSLDDIDIAVDRRMRRPAMRDKIAEILSDVEDKFPLVTNALIERYWGPQVASMFNN